jgi:NAD(P)-dependent dehydrogenase (short-subunit alcohol dehydrogenase family)
VTRLLEDKVVVVSGIGPGLGVHLATQAADAGARLVIAARTAERLDSAERDIATLAPGTEVLKVPTDIAKREQCKRLADAAIERYGRIDVLLNSAYIAGSFGPIESADLDDWRKTLDVNLFGTLGLTQEVLLHMKNARRGSIVNVNSQVTRKPIAGQAGYATSKAALACATSYLALECGQYGIRVNSVFLGWMWGPSVAGYFEHVHRTQGTSVETQKAAVAAMIPLGLIPPDSECARSIIYLASDMASVVTGAALDVNGGEYLPR